MLFANKKAKEVLAEKGDNFMRKAIDEGALKDDDCVVGDDPSTWNSYTHRLRSAITN